MFQSDSLRLLALGLCSLLIACSSNKNGSDGGDSDEDAGAFDAGSFDAGKHDAGPRDAGSFDAGMACKVKLESPNASCNTCMSAGCCESLTECAADPDCAACVRGDTSRCNPDVPVQRVYNACQGRMCEASCTEVYDCLDSLVDHDVDPICAFCLQNHDCCKAAEACDKDPLCWECLQGSSDPDCRTSATALAFSACLYADCHLECDGVPQPDFTNFKPACNAPMDLPVVGSCVPQGELFQCNPVTNQPCSEGQACDLDIYGFFHCFEPPNEGALCGACDPENGPFCQGGHTCANKKCARFCCENSECGTGKCDKTKYGMSFGVCSQ